MSYSDWIQSSRSQRVWLEDSMTALGQFAFIAPIHRVKHWDRNTGKRVKCWAAESGCAFCKAGLPKLNEFTYGIYINGDKEIKYLSATIAAHTLFQKSFSKIIDEKVNPTDVVFEIKRTKIKTSYGRTVNGYEVNSTDIPQFVEEKFRPSLYNSEEQEWRWVVPEEIADFLKDKEGDPTTLIDLFLLLRDTFSGMDEKDLKAYAVRLVDNNVITLKNAQEKWI